MRPCSPAEWGISCNGLCCALERDRYGVEHRSVKRVRKAECRESGPLRLEGGKGRKALPIPTFRQFRTARRIGKSYSKLI